MSKSSQTRGTIVDEALRQASVVGLEGLSLGPLADALRMSKSGLFAHFKSREALQVAVLESAVARFHDQVTAPALRRVAAIDRLQVLFTAWLRWIRGDADCASCIFITAAQEYDARPGVLRQHLVRFQSGLRGQLIDLVRQGVDEGVFHADADAGQYAFEIHGLALSFQQATHLLGDRTARRRALIGFQRLLDALRA